MTFEVQTTWLQKHDVFLHATGPLPNHFQRDRNGPSMVLRLLPTNGGQLRAWGGSLIAEVAHRINGVDVQFAPVPDRPGMFSTFLTVNEVQDIQDRRDEELPMEEEDPENPDPDLVNLGSLTCTERMNIGEGLCALARTLPRPMQLFAGGGADAVVLTGSFEELSDWVYENCADIWKRKYVAANEEGGGYDCDDYALQTMARARAAGIGGIGILRTDTHDCNVALCVDMHGAVSAHVFEPQLSPRDEHFQVQTFEGMYSGTRRGAYGVFI